MDGMNKENGEIKIHASHAARQMKMKERKYIYPKVFWAGKPKHL